MVTFIFEVILSILNMKKLSFLFLALAMASILPQIGHAQKIVADKIIAQVGDQIVLKSDVDNELSDAKRNEGQQGAPKLPPNAECVFIQNHLMQKALMLQAQRDSLPLTDDDVDGELDKRVRNYIQYYGGRDMLENIMGKTVFQFKESMRPMIKEQLLAQQEKQKIAGGTKITPEEVQAYYDKIPKDSLIYYESQLEVSQIVIHPKASKDVKAVVTDRLLGFKRDVESGKYKFEDLTKFSQDPAVKENGGLYSLNRLDKNFDPAFTSAAFRLKEGQISPVVESAFGLHILQMVSKVGDDATVRHILLIPPVSEIEMQQAVDSLDSVRKLINLKVLTFNAAVSFFSDDKVGKTTGGTIVSQEDGSSHITYDQIEDQSLIKILDTLKIGEVSKPQVFADNSNQGRGQQAVRLVYLRSRTDAHRENMKDDFDRISERALAIKQQTVLQDWFGDHIPTFYVHMDKDLGQCGNLTDWIKTSEKLELK